MKKCRDCKWYNNAMNYCNLNSKPESPRSCCDEHKEAQFTHMEDRK